MITFPTGSIFLRLPLRVPSRPSRGAHCRRADELLGLADPSDPWRGLPARRRRQRGRRPAWKEEARAAHHALRPQAWARVPTGGPRGNEQALHQEALQFPPSVRVRRLLG